MASDTYQSCCGRTFRFNDHVVAEMIFGMTDAQRSGRLVQIRLGRGAFGSPVYFIRRSDGTLLTFENVLLRHVDDRNFVRAFYLANDRPAPVIPPQDPDPGDTPDSTYTIKGKWPETGFLIEDPKQPESPVQSFGLTITSP